MFCFSLEVPGERNLFSFYKLCVHVQVNKAKFEKKFSRVLSYDLTWENKTCKLERSIMRKGVFLVSRKQTFECMRGRDNLFCKSFKWNLTFWKKKTDIQQGSSVWRCQQIALYFLSSCFVAEVQKLDLSTLQQISFFLSSYFSAR